MKKIFMCICVIFFLFFTLRGCIDNRTEREKIADHMMKNVSNVLKKRHQLKKVGWSRGGDKNNYKTMGLYFDHYGVMSKDEGRRMLIDSARELLNDINSDQLLLPFLQPSPFTMSNIVMDIYVSQPDGNSVFYPDIYAFALTKEKITYYTQIPEKIGFYTREGESYEEALKILHVQNKNEIYKYRKE